MTKNLQFVKKMDIFAYDNALDFIREFVEKATASGVSLRELARECNLAAPNYFQRALSENRAISMDAAKKIAAGLPFAKLENEYWLTLVKLNLPRYKDKASLKRDAQNIKSRAKKDLSPATEIHEHWLHSVIFEMALLKDFLMSVENIHHSLKRHASKDEIQDSLNFLLKHKWLVPTDLPHRYNQAAVEFDPYYDRRAIDMLKVHRQHLDMAKHKLNDDAKETEFLGLTTAIPFAKMPEVQKILRNAMDEIEFKIAGSAAADNVIIVHMSAFKVTER